MFEGLLNPANYPELLNIRPQTKFHTVNFGKNLDGDVTAKEVRIICGPSMEVHLRGAQPDPSAPPSLVFLHDSGSPLQTTTGIRTGPPPDGDVLDVPYFTQRDHPTNPDGTCNSSAHAMALAFLTGKISTDDEYNAMRERYGASTAHHPHTAVLSDHGLSSEWRTNLTFADIDNQLSQGIPVPIGILHRGPESNPRRNSGHICLVIGKTKDGSGYVIHDPYGSVNNDYADEQGANVVYTQQTMTARWMADGPGTGWGRIIRK